MGNLLRLLSRSEAAGSPDGRHDVFIDMEFAQPTESEEPQYSQIESVLTRAKQIMSIVENYPGAANEIRGAIKDPQSSEAQNQAWQSLQPLITSLQEVYNFCKDLESVVDTLLGCLCSAERTAKEHLEQQQALFTQFALIVEFVVKFDEVKMSTPSINNDLSYYKRVSMKHKDTLVRMNEDETSRMTMFFACHRPMMQVLTERTGAFMAAHKNIAVDITSECLAAIADICRGLAANPGLRQRLQKPEETVPLCLRVMTGVCVLYDFAHPLGVFHKRSLLDYRACIHTLRQEQEFKTLCESLINVLKYSTKTLNSPTTPKTVLAMLEE